jgi:hypothetical protein
MIVDHFDGKSLRNRSLAWLHAAVENALARYHDCSTSEAHARMWSNIAGKYQCEIERRAAAVQQRTAVTPQ